MRALNISDTEVQTDNTDTEKQTDTSDIKR